MRNTHLIILALLLAAGGGAERALAQGAAIPDTPVGHALQGLLSAFNTGDTARIRAFAEEWISSDSARVQRAVGYWNAVYREVGPLSLRMVSEDGTFWCRGDVTGAWIGLGLRVGGDAQRRTLRTGVTRVPLPPRLAAPRAPVPPEALDDSLGAFLEASAAGGHFSGAVVVARGGALLFARAYGFADRANGIRNTLDTRFKLASVTKMFTGVAISQLVERGLMSFDDPIQKYIPEYPAHIGRQVTVHHLLTHTLGIELDDDPEFNAAVARAESIDDLLATHLQYIERLNLGNYENFEPLGTYDYTNEGIDLLGVIVERVSGQQWDEYVREHIFEPAGMRSAGVSYLDAPPLAKPYTLRGDQPGTFVAGDRREVDANGAGVVGVLRPAGSGYASPSDMVRFMNALWGGEILGREYVQRMTSPQVDQNLPPQAVELLGRRYYGYTVDITDYPTGQRAVGHTGGAPGINTAVFRYPASDMTVVIVSNFDRGGWWVQQRVQELMFGGRE